jgi:cytochrome oxidase Cu insertion factor (SCO1/SenC/PrrC family)
MNGGLSPTNPALEAAFKSALLGQSVYALLIFTLLAIAWVVCRELLPPRARARVAVITAARQREPAGRRLLRIGFGVVWIFDAILQAQPQMPGGLPSQVIEPAAAGSPGWVLHLVNWAGTGWSYHPVQAAAATVWIQLGVGAWLIASASGRWSRLAGLASAGWGLVVWIFGEAFGSTLAPGLSLLTGAPGAALIYALAGLVIALPLRYWQTPALGRRSLRLAGAGLAAAALLQAWPGRGYWQGTLPGRQGSLASMVKSMAATPQPTVLARLVADFGTVVSAHGFAVNLVAVVVLATGAAALLSGRAGLIRPALTGLIVFFLADWVLVQDLGFFGGLGTDPNSMVPICLLLVGAFLAMTRVPAPAVSAQAVAAAVAELADVDAAGVDAGAEPAPGTPLPAGSGRAAGPGRAARPGRRLRIALGTASASVVVAMWAGAVIALGAAPMAVAEVQRTASPLIASALDGSPAALNFKAAPFDLTDQHGRQVSLASLHGKVILMTFLDPVCTSDCPLIAQEFRQADQVLGARSRQVALVAIVANPVYRSLAYTQAFDRQELLTGLPNWYFLTGSGQQLSQAWKDYYVTAQLNGPGAMALHPDVAYVIDARGVARTELNMDPGPGSPSSQSSFAVELAQAAERFLGQS